MITNAISSAGNSRNVVFHYIERLLRIDRFMLKNKIMHWRELL